MAAVLGLLLAIPVASSAAGERAVGRLAGPTRIETAAAVAGAAFPDGADEVYLARADVPTDALAGGSLPDGPVLLVPRCGEVPGVVAATIDGLAPDRVLALGGRRAVCDGLLESAAAGREDGRLAGADRYATAAEVARHAFPGGAPRVYVASGISVTDGVVAGSLTAGPVLLAPPSRPVPAATREAVDDLDPDEVVVIGGRAALSDGVLEVLADGRRSRRLAGATRAATAAAVAGEAFPAGAPRVYLARADDPADALVAGALTDGPVLLAPSCGAVPAATAAAVEALDPGTVVALGGERSMCAVTRDRAADLAPPPPATAAPTTPAGLAAAIRVSEEIVRGGDTPGWVASMATLGQVAYRALVRRPELREPTYDLLPPGLRGVAVANVVAGANLRAMVTELKDEPPSTWRIRAPAPPEELLSHYRKAEAASGAPWEHLAAINLVETRMGRIEGDSTAGAQGPMQFMPSTWDAYGEGDVHDDHDAIMAAGRYLRAHGAPHDMSRALYAYNHDERYVRAVTRYAQQIAAGGERVYRGYHGWQVWYLTTSGEVLLPVGWTGEDAR